MNKNEEKYTITIDNADETIHYEEGITANKIANIILSKLPNNRDFILQVEKEIKKKMNNEKLVEICIGDIRTAITVS